MSHETDEALIERQTALEDQAKALRAQAADRRARFNIEDADYSLLDEARHYEEHADLTDQAAANLPGIQEARQRVHDSKSRFVQAVAGGPRERGPQPIGHEGEPFRLTQPTEEVWDADGKSHREAIPPHGGEVLPTANGSSIRGPKWT